MIEKLIERYASSSSTTRMSLMSEVNDMSYARYADMRENIDCDTPVLDWLETMDAKVPQPVSVIMFLRSMRGQYEDTVVELRTIGDDEISSDDVTSRQIPSRTSGASQRLRTGPTQLYYFACSVRLVACLIRLVPTTLRTRSLALRSRGVGAKGFFPWTRSQPFLFPLSPFPQRTAAGHAPQVDFSHAKVRPIFLAPPAKRIPERIYRCALRGFFRLSASGWIMGCRWVAFPSSRLSSEASKAGTTCTPSTSFGHPSAFLCLGFDRSPFW
jgi:hypothetical protein